MKRRCGYIAIIGEPNVGKSTLVNQIIGSPVSIVSHKVQTTRVVLRGIRCFENSQIILIDTPGIFRPQGRNRLEKTIIRHAWNGMHEAHHVALMVDARRMLSREIEDMLQRITQLGCTVSLILNKIDLVSRIKLLPKIERIKDTYPFTRFFLVSALKNDGLTAVVEYFARCVPEGSWIYKEDQLCDAPIRFAASEITREKILFYLHQELPYYSTVLLDQWKETASSLLIHQTIVTSEPRHKAIILGKNGRSIRVISQKARYDIQNMIGKKVHLYIFVKVIPAWQDRADSFIGWHTTHGG